VQVESVHIDDVSGRWEAVPVAGAGQGLEDQACDRYASETGRNPDRDPSEPAASPF
jgi:hypothetical protein